MYEQQKIQEAEYFYVRMSEEIGDSRAFAYNLSAFLCAAQSVMLYAYEETKNNVDGRKWYKDWEDPKKHPVLGFFRKQRNKNVHKHPIYPSVTITPPPVTLGVSTGSGIAVIRDKDGNVVSSVVLSPETSPQPESRDGSSEYSLDGNEELMTAAQEYLDRLKDFVNDGVKNGFLTP